MLTLENLQDLGDLQKGGMGEGEPEARHYQVNLTTLFKPQRPEE